MRYLCPQYLKIGKTQSLHISFFSSSSLWVPRPLSITPAVSQLSFNMSVLPSSPYPSKAHSWLIPILVSSRKWLLMGQWTKEHNHRTQSQFGLIAGTFNSRGSAIHVNGTVWWQTVFKSWESIAVPVLKAAHSISAVSPAYLWVPMSPTNHK